MAEAGRWKPYTQRQGQLLPAFVEDALDPGDPVRAAGASGGAWAGFPGCAGGTLMLGRHRMRVSPEGSQVQTCVRECTHARDSGFRRPSHAGTNYPHASARRRAPLTSFCPLAGWAGRSSRRKLWSSRCSRMRSSVSPYAARDLSAVPLFSLSPCGWQRPEALPPVLRTGRIVSLSRRFSPLSNRPLG